MARARFPFVVSLVFVAALAQAQYTKYEYMIPMRDGVKLRTEVYVPTDKPGDHPILLQRTPYGAGPYGQAQRNGHGGSQKMKDAGYIFAYQDVRGRNMSEGDFVDIRPNNLFYTGPFDTDESTDTYDTIDFLIKNVPDNNGRVGLWGISYPGFYAAIGCVNSHPALKASSPQAPVSDWFMGDDFNHNGALFVWDMFKFMVGFGQPRTGPGQQRRGPDVGPDVAGDWYKFFLNLGPLSNIDERYYKGEVKYWNDVQQHPTYDEWWQARSLPLRMNNVKCAVMTVGGWFDAEDCYGAQNVYKGTERLNPGIYNTIVMGPWYHGMWAQPPGRRFHDQDWESDTSKFYQDEIEFPFFDAFLRGNGRPNLPEAYMFDSGAKRWVKFDQWPPPAAKSSSAYFQRGHSLSLDRSPGDDQGFDQYVSDPKNPVPSEGGVLASRTRNYMLADQRFAFARPDVLSYQTEPLPSDVTVAGQVFADLWSQITTTDADFVVKLIDVFPSDAEGVLKDYQMLVRGEIMPARNRHSFQNPKPMAPGVPELVSYELPGVFHTFRRGHRIMVQVQSSWFPLAAMSPQQFVNVFKAKAEDYVPTTVRIHRTTERPSRVRFSVLAG
jgi:putative CocE/NonD family hydrolase